MLWYKCITADHGPKTLKVTTLEEYLSMKKKVKNISNEIILVFKIYLIIYLLHSISLRHIQRTL